MAEPLLAAQHGIENKNQRECEKNMLMKFVYVAIFSRKMDIADS